MSLKSETIAETVARSNFLMGEDQGELAEYLVNAIDTAREYQISAEDTAREFLRLIDERLSY